MVERLKLQRRLGMIFLIFSILIYLVGIYNRALSGGTYFHMTDVIMFISIGVFLICSLIESPVVKIMQVVQLSIIGIFATVFDSIYSGAPIFCITFLLAYTYGYYDKYQKAKIGITAGGLFILALFFQMAENFNSILDAFDSAALFYVFIISVYFLLRDGNFTSININKRLDYLGNEIKALKKNKGSRHGRGKET
jgi:hypothetical protein